MPLRRRRKLLRRPPSTRLERNPVQVIPPPVLSTDVLGGDPVIEIRLVNPNGTRILTPNNVWIRMG